MLILLKFVIAFGVVGLLRSSEKFRTLSRETDEAVFVSIKRILRASEDSGYPPETILLFVALTTVVVIAMMAAAAVQP